MATPEVEVSSPIDDSLNSVHNNPHYNFLLELCQKNGEDLSEKDFEYFFKPISLSEMAEMAEMQITRDILEWIGYKGSVMEKYQSFERELIRNNYTYTSKLPSNPISEIYIPPKNTVLMIVSKVDYHNVILQLSTAKAAHLRKILIQVFHKWQNYQDPPYSKATSVGSDNNFSVQQISRDRLGNPVVREDELRCTNPFSMYYHNAGGMITQAPRFYIEASNSPYGAIALSEVWSEDDCPSDEIFDSTIFDVYTKNRSSEETKLSTGGGVLFAIRSFYKSEEIKLADVSGCIDQVCVRVEIPSLIINSVYFFVSFIRKGSRSEVYEAHVKNITDIVNKKKDENCNFVICGNFNLGDVDWCNGGTENGTRMLPVHCKSQNNFQIKTIESILSLNMNQKNDIKNSYGNILDLIFFDKRLKADLKRPPSVKYFKLLQKNQHHEGHMIDIDR